MSTRRQFVLSGLAGLSPLAAQDGPSFIVDVNVITAPVTVTDRDGRLVHGLEPKDFSLFDNTEAQNIKVDVSYVPISLVVAVQCSDRVEPLLGNIKKIGPMLESLVVGDQGEVAIMAFDHRIRVMTDGFTNDSKLLTAALNKINPGSKTSRMVDTVFDASRLLKSRPANRKKILVLIAETQDGGSEGRIREALLQAQVSNVIVYTISINRAVTKLLGKMDAPTPSVRPPAARGPMPGGAPQTPHTVDQMTGYGGQAGNTIPLFVEMFKQVKAIFVDNPHEYFTKYTGGREYSFISLKSLEDVMTKLGEDLNSQYLITYTPSDKVKMMGGWHDLIVDVSKPNVKVRTRPGYWMASKK